MERWLETLVWFAVPFGLSFLRLMLATLRLGRKVASVRRRLAVVAMLSALVTVPVLLPLVLGGSAFRGATKMVVEDGSAEPRFVPLPPPPGRPDYVIAVVAWLILLQVAAQSVCLPRRLAHMRRLPPVGDGVAGARIRELAVALGLRPPLVVEMATTGGAMDVQAFASGVLAPIVVVSDGVLHRVSPIERDAVLAHELAHVARHDVLRSLCAQVLVAAAAVLLSGWMPQFGFALLWLLPASWYVRALQGHALELRADAAAGRLVGYSAAATSLEHTHAANLQADSSPWFHALLTHPAMAVRAAALAAAAPPDQRADIRVDHAQANACRRARRVAILGWGAMLVALAGAGVADQGVLVACLAVPLFVLPWLPHLALLWRLRELLVLRAVVRALWQRLGVRSLFLVVAAAALPASPLLPDGWQWVAVPVALGFAVLALTWGFRERRARRELELLLMQRDFEGWRTRWSRLPPRWRWRDDVRVLASLVTAALGDRPRAIAELRALRGERPRLHEATAWLVVLLRHDDKPGATALARQLLVQQPRVATNELLLVGCLRRQGLLDEAWELVQSVLHRRWPHGSWSAVACRVALARGERDAARGLLERAERLAPGDTATLVARAEYDVVCGRTTAAASLQRLRDVAQRLPLAFLDADVALLERALAGAVSPDAQSGFQPPPSAR